VKQTNIIISDTTCLIGLTNIGLLDILKRLYNTVLVTPEVAKEFGEPLPDWVYITAVENTEKTQELFTKLDLGESSSIALALETKNALVILDERKARNIARSLGLDITGTVGVLLEAYQQGFISDFYSAISRLRQINFRIPPDSEIKKLSKMPR
jgi:predicted nucleic acid-binding protein